MVKNQLTELEKEKQRVQMIYKELFDCKDCLDSLYDHLIKRLKEIEMLR
jgi:hypothetical protein